MKAELIDPEPVDKLVQLTMTQDQAKDLIEILGAIGGQSTGNHRKSNDEIYIKLSSLLSYRMTNYNKILGLVLNTYS